MLAAANDRLNALLRGWDQISCMQALLAPPRVAAGISNVASELTSLRIHCRRVRLLHPYGPVSDAIFSLSLSIVSLALVSECLRDPGGSRSDQLSMV